jgi:hypothetical protein
LEEYLEYRLKRKIAERLIGNVEGPGMAQMYANYGQQERINLKNASNELKMRSITPTSMQRLKRINRLESLQFESAFTRMYS